MDSAPFPPAKGNMPLDKTTRNAVNILGISGLQHIPVVAGLAKPLMRPAFHCPDIHGENEWGVQVND